MLHKNARRIHKVYDLTFNNSIEREAYIFTIDDEGKFYRQLDNNTLWFIIDVNNGVATWKECATIEDTNAGGSNPYPQYLQQFDFVQSTPATTWTINHNLNKPVSITTYTTGGVEFEGEIIKINNNQSQVLIDEAIAGTALVQ
ncbi:MAG: hypothetical protein WC679_00050 [Bacteroidales bacterium]|jgi:hypothetical protein